MPTGCSVTGGAVIRLRRTSEARGGNPGVSACAGVPCGAANRPDCWAFSAAWAWRDSPGKDGVGKAGTWLGAPAAGMACGWPPCGGPAATASKRNLTDPSSLPFESTASASFGSAASRPILFFGKAKERCRAPRLVRPRSPLAALTSGGLATAKRTKDNFIRLPCRLSRFA